MLNKLKLLLNSQDSSEDELLEIILEQAEGAVLKKLYPYHPNKKTIPKRYESTVINIAVYLYNKRGAEGQRRHREGDITREYESGHIPDSMLIEVVPMVGVIK